MKTYQPKQKDVKRNWCLIDAKGEILGRMATTIAKLLMGKHKPAYSAHMVMGDNVVVINATKVELTGKKKEQKVYQSHSGYSGGFKEVKFAKLFEEQPEKVITYAVSGMLPDNRLKRERMERLRVFKEYENPYMDKFKNEK